MPVLRLKTGVRRGCDEKEPCRQRYECNQCQKRFDDLTGTVFAGHHQPLKVWILCLYLMGLNLPNEQIAQELDLDRSDVQQMTTQLREGVVKKAGGKSPGAGRVRRGLRRGRPQGLSRGRGRKGAGGEA